MAVFCGIDWAEDHHDIALVDQDGTLLVKRRIDDDAAGFDALLQLMADTGDQPDAPMSRHSRRRSGVPAESPTPQPDNRMPDGSNRRFRLIRPIRRSGLRTERRACRCCSSQRRLERSTSRSAIWMGSVHIGGRRFTAPPVATRPSERW